MRSRRSLAVPLPVLAAVAFPHPLRAEPPAIALRETGSVASARALVKRARPFLVSSPFVDWYTKEILGN